VRRQRERQPRRISRETGEGATAQLDLDWRLVYRAVEPAADRLARRRAEGGHIDADLGDRAQRRAQHSEAAAGHAGLDRSMLCEFTWGVAAALQRELQRLRTAIDVIGNAQPAQQQAHVDFTGVQVELRRGHIAAQVELGARAERRACELAVDR
jgi:hypothetical protein